MFSISFLEHPSAVGDLNGDDTHEFLVLADTGESEVFYDRAVTELTLGSREIDWDDRAQLAALDLGGGRGRVCVVWGVVWVEGRGALK